MPEFINSWAFAFILGCFIGGAFGFLVAVILIRSIRALEIAKREKRRRSGRRQLIGMKITAGSLREDD